MKRCPYCNAELHDNAQFCYYCMKQFDKKVLVQPKTHKNHALGIILPLIGLGATVTIVLAICLSSFLIPKDRINRFDDIVETAKSDATSHTSEALQGSPEAEQEGGITTGGPSNPYSPSGSKTSYSSASSSASVQNNSAPASSKTNPNFSVRPNNSKPSETNSSPSSKINSTSSSANSNSSSQSSSRDSSQTHSSQTSSTQPPATPQWETRTVSGGVEITGIGKTNSNGIYTIPSKIDGKTVVGIGDSAFYYSNIKSISLPATVKYIDEKAFYGCNYITSIVLPKSVERIGLNAFTCCKKLAHIYIAGNSVEIHDYAFSTHYQRDVDLTIHAPSSVMDSMTAHLCWDASYEEWNG